MKYRNKMNENGKMKLQHWPKHEQERVNMILSTGEGGEGAGKYADGTGTKENEQK
jgi:hypothetical protein